MLREFLLDLVIKLMVQRAAQFLKHCNTIIIGAGAGFGRDSGLPDFRGNQGFWNNYPPYRNKFNFIQCANPNFLLQHPNLFWGFYGSRLKMYRQKNPHKGFEVIKRLSKRMAQSSNGDNLFVVTSNVDGHFTKAQYPSNRIFEAHGTIHHLQCNNCNVIKPNNFQPDINFQEMKCNNLPQCQKCGQIQRPNIRMFGDWDWNEANASKQQSLYRNFLNSKQKQKLAIIEVGCGSAVPTIRNMMQQLYYMSKDSKFIRINLDKSQSSAKWFDSERYIDVELSAQQALQKIQQLYDQ